MITINLHFHGKEIENNTAVEDISEILRRPDDLVWLDVMAPTSDDLAILSEEFDFHPLAMEDALNFDQRPKLDLYDGFMLVVFKEINVVAGGDGAAIKTAQIGLFVGKNYVVTIHERPIQCIKDLNERWRQRVEAVGSYSSGLLLYSILDAIVDGYFPVLDAISDRMSDLEEHVFEALDLTTQQDIFRLKKELVAMRRILAPEREVMNVLIRRDTPVFETEDIVYFQDVYDHVLRVTDEVDTYRDLLSSALEFHLAATSNQLNQVMKTMTALSVVLMSVTLIASIYGMNFVHMPELKWHLGYLWAIGLMVAIGIGALSMFRRYDWI